MALYVRGAAMSVRTWCRIGRPMPCRVRPDHPCPAARLPKVKLARIELVRPMDVARVHVDRAATVEKEHAVRRDPLQSCRHPARRIYLHRLRKLRSVCIWVRSAKSPALVVFLPAFNCVVGIVVQLIVVRVDIEEGTMH